MILKLAARDSSCKISYSFAQSWLLSIAQMGLLIPLTLFPVGQLPMGHFPMGQLLLDVSTGQLPMGQLQIEQLPMG